MKHLTTLIWFIALGLAAIICDAQKFIYIFATVCIGLLLIAEFINRKH